MPSAAILADGRTTRVVESDELSSSDCDHVLVCVITPHVLERPALEFDALPSHNP
jgi:hypothetical protein